MTHINLTFNPYQELLTIQINNVPISPRSLLKKFERMSFLEWSEQIFPILSQEINDNFDIEYSGQMLEFEILKYYANKHEDCNGIRYTTPVLNEAPIHRLKVLNQLFGNGVLPSVQRRKMMLYVFANSTPMLKAPNLSFCKIQYSIQSLALLREANYKVNDTIFVILNDTEKDLINQSKNVNNNVYWLIIGERFECLSIKGRQLTFTVPLSKITDIVQDCLNFHFYPHLLMDMMQEINSKGLNREIDEMQYLDKIEPGVKITIPRFVEVGKSEKINIQSVPDGYRTPAIEYQYSDGSLMDIRNHEIFAKEEGVVYVTAVNAVTGLPIITKSVSCEKRIHLDRITIEQKDIVLCEGETFKLRLKYYPPNADDISKIKYISSNPLVAYGEKETIYAKHSGVCSITLSCEQVNIECCVEVRPPMTSFTIEPSEIKLPLGAVEQLKLQQYPSTSFPERYEVKTYPEGIVEVDINSRMIRGLALGGSIVEISTSNGRIKKTIRVTVYENSAIAQEFKNPSSQPRGEQKQNILDKIFRRK